jgi:hypothetical protein
MLSALSRDIFSTGAFSARWMVAEELSAWGLTPYWQGEYDSPQVAILWPLQDLCDYRPRYTNGKVIERNTQDVL